MNKQPLLSICIPTYNRAELVTVLLNYLYKEYEKLSFDDKENCEILVRDNCSEDNTEYCITEFLSSKKFASYHRNDTNIGATNNFLLLTQEAKGEYVWLLADDDELKDGLVGKILDSLHRYKPAMLFINHSGRVDKNTPVLFSSTIDYQKPEFYENGRQAIADIIGFGQIGCALFVSAKVVRSDLLLKACHNIKLPDGSMPLYVAFFAASKGSVAIIKEPMIENIYGKISWGDRKKLICYEQIPATIGRLKELGYTTRQINVVKKQYFSFKVRKNILLYNLGKKFPFLKIIQNKLSHKK